ncbi:phytoene desaturase family protein [Mycolicibacterium smegmatis]|uniref:Phytoene desaturase n=3 Tax=Mycolicibacterium smegmatis TaxID=1772 RepID=I7FZT2_MYCS2|nr:phytoene desaturase family protein [Mycolicibacterium smegmatis]ABK74949.1 phytoene dehydrogenase [Mycolicibacterium smegmatis MC2 155]AFP38757.1 Phytoene desaturase [Mycolicibacterium smegmatis MC2 155]AIU07532.1 phytoene dehydrogenase [Mycolicibacterium smegmatis MC2 155]AIU14157.1 phytoene dehydrogenase [Mycolicibacterium smegmatis]AIU20780.1 phytoene dehydrogenase [Mycolicibacterium smegmatis]
MSRAIPGPTDHVVVVGAGLSGLSAALHLAGRGRRVTVVEREPWPGGRAGRIDTGGYRIDTGPTVLTMPDILDDVFAAVGESVGDRLQLLPVDPAYRAQFADGSALEVHSDADRMAAAIADLAGPSEAAGYRRLRDWLTRLYRIEIDGFIGANFDSPLSLLTPQLAQLAAIGGFGKWDHMVRRHLRDPRLQRVFTFQSLYAGVSPQRALAAYAVIAYMDTISGVFFPKGGVRAVPDALAAAGADAGVRFHYGATVNCLERSADRVTAVHTDTGERIPCDAVVLTTELPRTYELLGRTPRRPRPWRASPSAVVVHVGCRRIDRPVAHHNILFGDAWHDTFTDIIDDGRLMRDPSLLVTRPTRGDPALAPAGRDLLYLLAPTPNLSSTAIDWETEGPAYAQRVVDTVAERLLPELRDDAQVLQVVTPADWARQGMVAGTPFALAHTFSQTGPFRPGNTVRGVANAVLAGSSTVPGVGVPTALLSGRLAADRVTGTVRRTRTHHDINSVTAATADRKARMP